MLLTPIELRVLGSLMEKEITTPEYYPLSLNALVNACNQRSSRDPVLELTESEVRDALYTLQELQLVSTAQDARVPKFEHRARTVLNLRRDETAVLCLLLLRGPQTPGELRSRADRLHSFDDLAAVVATLDRLAARPDAQAADAPANATGPLTVLLPRQPGAREARYAHLLGGPVAGAAADTSAPRPNAPSASAEGARIAALEEQLAEAQAQIATLASRLQALEARLGPATNPTNSAVE
ncbi:MAG: YceH family protein [Acidobacteriota bacterium]|nr:YceH family protein [Acidobacteriota bacterium]